MGHSSRMLVLRCSSLVESCSSSWRSLCSNGSRIPPASDPSWAERNAAFLATAQRSTPVTASRRSRSTQLVSGYQQGAAALRWQDRPAGDAREDVAFPAFTPCIIVRHHPVHHVLRVSRLAGNAVDRKQRPSSVMAHQPLGIVEAVYERAYDGGVADLIELLGGRVPLDGINSEGEYIDDGRRPARIGPDLPKGLGKINELIGQPIAPGRKLGRDLGPTL